MRKIFTVTIVFALAIAFSSCATRKVSRVNTNEVIDLSGRWNDTDSQLVSAEMIDDLLGARWLPVYESQHNNKRPVVVVGTVTNKSHEHINSETFIKDIEKAIIKNGSVRLVQAGEKRQELRTERDEQNQGYTSPETAKKWGLELGADFMLQGTINSIVDSYKKEQVVYYQVDLELTNLETNEVVWMGDKKIKNKLATEPCKRKATQILILDLRFSIDHLRTVSCNVIHRKSQIKNSK
ncbi:MAG: penicillin-binding protein activator LpoB [Odoribacter splanchnicus]